MLLTVDKFIPFHTDIPLKALSSCLLTHMNAYQFDYAALAYIFFIIPTN